MTNPLTELKEIKPALIKESYDFLNSMIAKINNKIPELIKVDDKNRAIGMPYKKRLEIIDKIEVLKELGREYQCFLKNGIRPLNEWIDEGDIESLECNGYEWYVKTYFRRIFKPVELSIK